jgi:chromate transport protein ChrA
MKLGNPIKTLTRLVALNIVFDAIAIATWTALPSSGGNLHYINTSVASIEAAIAIVLFAVTLFGLTKKQSWAPKAAIAITIIQRTFATIVFFPSPGIIATLIWSIIIIYFAYKTIKTETVQNNKL